MPYIPKDDRKKLLEIKRPANSGQLNFQLTMTILNYIGVQEGINYKIINDILGALEGAKLEFYRRIVVPYEESKIKENGDVY